MREEFAGEPRVQVAGEEPVISRQWGTDEESKPGTSASADGLQIKPFSYSMASSQPAWRLDRP